MLKCLGKWKLGTKCHMSSTVALARRFVQPQILPTMCWASMYSDEDCKHTFKYKRSRLETITLSKVLQLDRTYAFLAFIAFGAGAAAFFAAFLAILLTDWTWERCRMQVSLKTSFLEPDQEPTCTRNEFIESLPRRNLQNKPRHLISSLDLTIRPCTK
jgi:hypothetical protein